MYLERRLKMKALKKIYASVMVTAMLATMGISAFADASNFNDDIRPRGAQCEFCGQNGVIVVDSYTTEWVVVDVQPCNWEGASEWDFDDIEERTLINTVECTNCGRGQNNTSVQQRRVHNHDRW